MIDKNKKKKTKKIAAYFFVSNVAVYINNDRVIWSIITASRQTA